MAVAENHVHTKDKKQIKNLLVPKSWNFQLKLRNFTTRTLSKFLKREQCIFFIPSMHVLYVFIRITRNSTLKSCQNQILSVEVLVRNSSPFFHSISRKEVFSTWPISSHKSYTMCSSLFGFLAHSVQTLLICFSLLFALFLSSFI